MAVPTITSVNPAIGHTGGRSIVEIRGTGFQTWVIPPIRGRHSDPVWPTVEVLFGGVAGTGVSVISSERLYVRVPSSPVPVLAPKYGEGAVDVTVRNITKTGSPIALETATLAAGYTYQRVQLTATSDYSRLVQQVVLEMRKQIIGNVSIGSHADYDAETADGTNIVDVAELPAVVLFGPTVQENRLYGQSGRLKKLAENDEVDVYDMPETDDLVFSLVGISDQKQEELALQLEVRQFFRNNKWINILRDPANPERGYARYEIALDFAGLSPNAPVDQKSNLKSFSGSFVVRGFDQEAHAGFPQSDRVARGHRVVPTPVPPPPPDPPLSSSKNIVTFELPYGTGTIGNGTIHVLVPHGTAITSLVPTITHSGVSISPPSGVAQNFTAPVTYTITAENGTTKNYVVTVEVEAQTGPDPEPVGMRLGTNFWYHTPLTDNWSGETSMVAGINWASAYGAGTSGLAATNIWNTTFLSELAPYGVLRFMDWGAVNFSQIVTWSQRMLPTDPQNYSIYIDGDSVPGVAGMSYEWMIDLCNRTGKDLWICVPAMSDEDYWYQLAVLVRDKLNPARRVYIEYSNETWNGSFAQFYWTIEQGQNASLPGDNEYYQGQSFSVLQSLGVFRSFQQAFGAEAMGVRVIRVFAYGGNMDTGRLALRDIYQSSTYNFDNQVIDMLALAPYIGSELDGLSPTIRDDFHSEINNRFDAEIAEAVADKATYGIAKLGTYEGGQHLLHNSQAWTENSYIYDEYRYMLDKWSDVFSLFMHYTHTGRWTNDDDKSSWGALDHTGQSPAAAHKYRALVDYHAANS